MIWFGVAWFIVGVLNAGLASYVEGMAKRTQIAPFWLVWARVAVGPIFIVHSIISVCHLLGIKKR